jgi:hypothetical protein
MQKIDYSKSFRCPVQQTPAALANAFQHDPLLSLKIDGIFHEIKNKSQHHLYYPKLNPNWTKIEGELYENESGKQILFVFYIDDKKKNLETLDEMSEEILKQSPLVLSKSEDIATNIRENIEIVNKFVESLSSIENQIIWVPKPYYKLKNQNWNSYIEELDKVFKSICDINTIKHDGCILSPNQFKTPKSYLVKLKPRKDFTIDLYFNGKKFFSRDRTEYTQLIESNISHNCVRGEVYRLKPNLETNLYQVEYKRELGKRANPDNIIYTILYCFFNNFEIIQLKDVYNSPWYGNLDKWSLLKDDLLMSQMKPIFEHVQSIYHQIIPKYATAGHVLDLGCGALGQYASHFVKNRQIESFTGLDIDLAVLHEAQVKVNYDNRFKFILFDLNYDWSRQNERWPSGLWNAYFKNMFFLNRKHDFILSIFSISYTLANLNNFVTEIDTRSKTGTKLFIIFPNSDLMKEEKAQFYEKQGNQLILKFPHKPEHKEPLVSREMILNGFKEWQLETSRSLNERFSDDWIDTIDWILLCKN